MTHINQTSAAPAKSARHVIENVSRRGLFAGAGAAGAFVLMARLGPSTARAADSMHYDTGGMGMPHGMVSDPHVFISIDPSGQVTIVAHRSEMGTGSRTSLPMVVAEEMDADWSRVTVVQAPGDEPKYGNQDTDGSRSLRHFYQPMRDCGAAMRMMLEAAAAKQWGVPVSDVAAGLHEVVNKTNGKKLGYGALAVAASAMATPATDTLTFKDPATYRYIGKGNVQIVDLFNITTGRATYGADVKLPGKVYAVIARPPVVGGKVVSFDATEAMKVPGVIKVMEAKGWQPPGTKFLPLGGVAVIAKNTGSAIQGRDKLKIVWDDGPNKTYDSVAFRATLEESARNPDKVVRKLGDADAALKSAAKVVSAEYYTPHFSHATMEPPVGLVSVTKDGAEVWAPVQSPYGTREDLAKLLELPIDKVKVNVTLLGGGFGRKSKCDYVLEAGLLSKAMGVPVQVQWTREDDLQHAFYHTVAAQKIEAGVDANGKVVALKHACAAPTILSTFKAGADHLMPLEQGMGLVDLPYDVPNILALNGKADAHARIGWYRSVYNVPHGFAMQSFIAELAHELGKDPKDMLLEIIGPPRIDDMRKQLTDELWNYGEPWDTHPIDAGRLRRVAEMAAEKAGWGKTLPAGEGMGIAAHRSFVSYIATVVHVKVDGKGNISVPQVDYAVDCGFHVNPERIESQFQGAAVMGLTLAKYSAITFKDGRVEQSNYDNYPMVRIDESPKVTNVHVVPATFANHASGVGEPGVPPFAPALCNAIFAATGKRIRSLPIGNQLA